MSRENTLYLNACQPADGDVRTGDDRVEQRSERVIGQIACCHGGHVRGRDINASLLHKVECARPISSQQQVEARTEVPVIMGDLL